MSSTPTDRSGRPAGLVPPPIQVQPLGRVQPASAPQPARMDDIVIGRGVTSTGNFSTGGQVCVDGVLHDAEVHAAALSVSQGGEFHGKAMVQFMEVFGTFRGEVNATDQVVLRASSVVSGKISAPYVVVHRGATITGQIETLQRQFEADGAQSKSP